MTLVDVNVLLNAINGDSEHRDDARTWLESAIESAEPTGLTWTVVAGFLRLTTRLGILAERLEVADAASFIADGLAHPGVRILQERKEHWLHLSRLLAAAGTAGNLTMDAHLAAVAISHGATVVSFDRDFERFPWVLWKNPATSI